MSKNKEKLTATNLKEVLWETLQGVKTGKLDHHTADAVAVQAREIIRTTNTQLRVAAQSKRDVPTDVLNFSENK